MRLYSHIRCTVNDMEDFHLPDHYIRYIEPIESELATQVEYDMDEQGMFWVHFLSSVYALALIS